MSKTYTKDDLPLLQPLLQDPLLAALAKGDSAAVTCLLAERFKLRQGERPSAWAYVWEQLLQADNFFSRRAAAGEADAALTRAMAAELAVLRQWLAAYQPPEWLCAAKTDADCWPNEPAEALAEFHRRNGFGPLALHRVWRWEGRLRPVLRHDTICLADLIGYQSQKDEVLANTRLFVRESRGNNLLLYGARGTGKSSLIKAVANELAAEGLCLVELPLEHIGDLPRLLQLLGEQPRHYLIFIDDLSFEKADHSYKVTKAVLEGSVAARGNNVLIYATSNRRHLIVENWQDREGVQHNNGEVRASDSMSEKLSLADRFGQTVLFTTPNQEEYLRIVAALAAADGVRLPAEELRTRALKWALWQNGCSGRTARQFVNSLGGAQ